jgi:hypothetical protein
MSLIASEDEHRASHPVDLVETIAQTRDWAFERSGLDEITISVAGRHADYHVSFTWMSEIESLHLACAFDLKVPQRRRAEVQALVARINEQLWLGHFDQWTNEGVVMFRHGLLLAGGLEPTDRQCEALMEAALDACERHYPSFQFVVWSGHSADQALEAALFETVGEA